MLFENCWNATFFGPCCIFKTWMRKQFHGRLPLYYISLTHIIFHSYMRISAVNHHMFRIFLMCCTNIFRVFFCDCISVRLTHKNTIFCSFNNYRRLHSAKTCLWSLEPLYNVKWSEEQVLSISNRVLYLFPTSLFNE